MEIPPSSQLHCTINGESAVNVMPIAYKQKPKKTVTFKLDIHRITKDFFSICETYNLWEAINKAKFDNENKQPTCFENINLNAHLLLKIQLISALIKTVTLTFYFCWTRDFLLY